MLRLVADMLDRPKAELILTQATFSGQARTLRKGNSAGRSSAVRRSASSTRKKVVIHKFGKTLVKGYVNPRTYLTHTGVEVLDREGRLLHIALEELKGVFFVRDFEGRRERPERKVFQSRPKLSGLWIRMAFKDNEVLEGLISNNLLNLDPKGFLVTPADVYSNNLKILVPRGALLKLEVLGLISDRASRKAFQQSSEAPRDATNTSAQAGLPPTPRLPGAKSR